MAEQTGPADPCNPSTVQSLQPFVMSPGFKCGFVAVVGAPNAGKSTLVNLFCGRKVSGVSAKPQTTRRRVLGVRSEEGAQFVFVDTPGYGRTEERLGELMGRAARAAARETDVILCVVDAVRPESGEEMKALLRGARGPALLAVNKTDAVAKPGLLPLLERFSRMAAFAEVVPVSARDADGTDVLLRLIRERLPEGPPAFDSGPAGGDDRAVAALVQEVVQEKLFDRVHREIPYGCAVMVEGVEREGGLIRVSATVITEREAHKPILIGKGGEMLRAVGTGARRELERQLQAKVFLKLWVKVEEDWRNREAILNDLGYME